MFWKNLLSVNLVRLQAVCSAVFVSHVLNDQVKSREHEETISLSDPKEKSRKVLKTCREIVKKKMMEFGAPGLVVGVAVNGVPVWTEGFGYADIENNVPCSPNTVMRIASISKSLTMTAVAKLMEDGKLNIDKSIYDYLPEFPVKYYKDKKAEITTRLLLSHMGGIRHYHTEDKDKPVKEKEAKEITADIVQEYEQKEYFSMKKYKSVMDSLEMFKNDELVCAPGEKFLYTTHGWTLISAIVERAAGEDFVLHMKKMFKIFNMTNTFPESSTGIIYNRSRQYTRNRRGRLVNSPYVDNSYKWAGGGFLSNVPDLLTFGSIMLYCSQLTESAEMSEDDYPKGYLKSDTIKKMWSTVIKRKTNKNKIPSDSTYGMGWVVYPEKQTICAKEHRFAVGHTGGAIGGSSILYIVPTKQFDHQHCDQGQNHTQCGECCRVGESNAGAGPKGIVIAILTNLQAVNLTNLAQEIAREFESLDSVVS